LLEFEKKRRETEESKTKKNSAKSKIFKNLFGRQNFIQKKISNFALLSSTIWFFVEQFAIS